MPKASQYDETDQAFRSVRAKVPRAYHAYDERGQFFEPKPVRPTRAKIQDKEVIPPVPAFKAYDEPGQFFEPKPFRLSRAKIQDKEGFPSVPAAYNETHQFFEDSARIQDEEGILYPLSDLRQGKYIMANYKVGPNTWIETEVSRKRQNLDDKKAGVKKARFDYVGPFRPTAPSPPSYDDVSSF